MAEASSSNNPWTKCMRRVLFVGRTGVGKSTLINVLINKKVTAESMLHSAGAGDTSHGQTNFFVTYYDFPDNAYTDSIGLGDNRFEPEDVMKSMKSVIKNSVVDYNKIYLCIQYGRISSDTRCYIDLLTTIFGGEVLKWCSIIFTRCNDQTMTKAFYLLKNNQDGNIVEIINQVQTVIFGNNMTDQDSEMEMVLRRRRQLFLDRIKQDIDITAQKEYFKLQSESLLKGLLRMLRIMFHPYEKVSYLANDIKNFAQATVTSMQSSKLANYFTECSICAEDMTDKNELVITKCNHVYHKVCIDKWFNGKVDKQCPICRTKFIGHQETFYTN